MVLVDDVLLLCLQAIAWMAQEVLWKLRLMVVAA